MSQYLYQERHSFRVSEHTSASHSKPEEKKNAEKIKNDEIFARIHSCRLFNYLITLWHDVLLTLAWKMSNADTKSREAKAGKRNFAIINNCYELEMEDMRFSHLQRQDNISYQGKISTSTTQGEKLRKIKFAVIRWMYTVRWCLCCWLCSVVMKFNFAMWIIPAARNMLMP